MQVQQAQAKLKNFNEIHQDYLHYREVGKDETKETALVEEQEQHYEEVMNNLYGSLQLYTD
jgi:hypothetical protein